MLGCGKTRCVLGFSHATFCEEEIDLLMEVTRGLLYVLVSWNGFFETQLFPGEHMLVLNYTLYKTVLRACCCDHLCHRAVLKCKHRCVHSSFSTRLGASLAGIRSGASCKSQAKPL